jgi:threonine synthase
VDAIRFTNGVVAAVSDEEILAAKQVIDTSGVGCEPASAASVAGVRALAARGVIAPDARVVAVLTGHVLKDPEIRNQGGMVEIDAELGEVERVLREG